MELLWETQLDVITLLKITKFGFLLCIWQTIFSYQSYLESVRFFVLNRWTLYALSLCWANTVSHLNDGIIALRLRSVLSLEDSWLLFPSICRYLLLLNPYTGWMAVLLSVSLKLPYKHRVCVVIIWNLPAAKHLSGILSQRTSRSQCQGKSGSDFHWMQSSSHLFSQDQDSFSPAFIWAYSRIDLSMFLFPSNFKKCARDLRCFVWN